MRHLCFQVTDSEKRRKRKKKRKERRKEKELFFLKMSCNCLKKRLKILLNE